MPTFNSLPSHPENSPISFSVSDLTGYADGTIIYWAVGNSVTINQLSGKSYVIPDYLGQSTVSGESITITTTVPVVSSSGDYLQVSLYSDVSRYESYFIATGTICGILETGNDAQITVSSTQIAPGETFDVTITSVDADYYELGVFPYPLSSSLFRVVVGDDYPVDVTIAQGGYKVKEFPGTKTVRFKLLSFVDKLTLGYDFKSVIGKKFKIAAVGNYTTIGTSPELTIVEPSPVSVTGVMGIQSFPSLGSFALIEAAVQNYNSFFVSQTSSIAGTEGLLLELSLDSDQSVSFSNFNLTTFTKVSSNLANFYATASEDIISKLILTNISGLSKLGAPYLFTVSLKAKLERLSDDRTLVVSRQYSLPAELFPNPFYLSLVTSSQELRYKKPFTITITANNIAENLTFEGKSSKYIGIFCTKTATFDITNFSVSEASRLEMVSKPAPAMANTPFVVTDILGNKGFLYKFTASETAKTLEITLDSIVSGLDTDNFTFYFCEFETTYVRIPISNPYETIQTVQLASLTELSGIDFNIPSVVFLDSYYENSTGTFTVNNLEGFNGQTVYWKLELLKAASVFKQLAVGSATVASGMFSITSPVPSVYADNYGLKITVNGTDNFALAAAPNFYRDYNYIVQIPDDVTLVSNKNSITHGEVFTLTASSASLGLKNLQISLTSSTPLLTLASFSRIVDGVATDLSSNFTIKNFNGTATITLKLKESIRKVTGFPFRFNLLTDTDTAMGVVAGDLLAASNGMIVPIPDPISYSMTLTTPVAGELHLNDAFTLDLTVNNLAENNLRYDSLTTDVFLGFPVLPFVTFCSIDSVSSSNPYTVTNTILNLKLLPTESTVQLKFKYFRLDRSKHLQLPLLGSIKAFESITALGTPLESSNEVMIARATPPGVWNFKTMIFNRNKNNTYAPFEESHARQGLVKFMKYNTERLEETAKVLNTSMYPGASDDLKPMITEESLRSQTRFNILTKNQLDKVTFDFEGYSPYLMLNINSLVGLEGNYIISMDSDYTTQNNLIFDTMKKSSTYNHTPDYRCLYLKNTHPDDMALQIGIYIAEQPSAKDVLEVGLDPAGKNGTAQTIANAFTPPSGVTFSQATYDNPLVVGTLMPNESIAFWIKRYSTSETEAPAVIDISRIAYKALV